MIGSMTPASDTEQLDRDVRLELYRLFTEQGHPPVAAQIAASLGVGPLEVEESLRRLHDAHMIVLAPGTPYVWMANPFSAVPTPYKATLADGRSYFGNCIWDALGIVSMLGREGRVGSHCPDCGEGMSLEISGDDITGEGLVHYAVPARHWWDDIGFN